MLNNNVFKVMSLFLSDYSNQIHGWEAARELNMNQKTVSNVLSKMEKENILRSRTEGRNKIYRLNLMNPGIMHVLAMTEEERTLRFRTDTVLKELIHELIKSNSPMVVVFGSYADGTNKKGSDIDILVLSPFQADLSKIEMFYKIKTSIKEYTEEEFREALKSGDFLIKEVLRNHVVLYGVDLFVKMVLEEIHERDGK